MRRDLTGLSLALVLACFLSPGSSHGHPAHAKPVNYPYVVGFERFHSSLDDDEYLAKGGMILLNELNCVACHEPPERLRGQLQGVEATNLAGVTTRLGDVDLEIMIRNPRFLKKDTVMPSLFAGPDRDLEEVKALKQYLATFEQEIPEYPVGDIERGRTFYHRVGCAACHAPEVGYRPPGIPENAEIEMAGLPSVPMNLADLYDLDALTHFLLTPNEHRPSGRMPEFHLTVEEAADLAAYLKAGPDLELPENITQALAESDPVVPDSELVAQGRDLFVQKSCTACHSIPGSESELDQFRATPLEALSVEEWIACLSDRPSGGGVPFYGLDEVQKRAITAALVRLSGKSPLAGPEEIDWRMKSLNCYACHERAGVGGAETAREVYFGFESEEAIELGRWGHLPPDLSEVEHRLGYDWLTGVLFGEGWIEKSRPYLSARMPAYAIDRVTPLVDLLLEETMEEYRPAPEENEGQQEMVGFFQKECRSCHAAGKKDSNELPGINLRYSTDRLRYPYFESIILHPQETRPGVPMAPVLADDADAKAKVEQLWRYLDQLPWPTDP